MSQAPVAPSAASPASGSSESSFGNLKSKELELQRKRARDRKSQQAMRDRTKWTIANLTEQVNFLTQTLDERTRDVGLLDVRLRMLETENAHLRAQNAALQLSLIGSTTVHSPAETITMAAANPKPRDIWEVGPVNSPPTCIADQILQGFLESKRGECVMVAEHGSSSMTPAYPLKPNLAPLLHKGRRTDDDISNLVGDIVRSYLEINTLPEQGAVFYVMSTLLKWMVLLDKESWDQMPVWLRPTQSQLSTPHAAWVDRIPWPKAREYLVAHPEITLDDWATSYSSSMSVSWPYDPSHVLLVTNRGDIGGEDVNFNPVYEEHLRQLKNWSVGSSFRNRFPEIAACIDESCDDQPA